MSKIVPIDDDFVLQLCSKFNQCQLYSFIVRAVDDFDEYFQFNEEHWPHLYGREKQIEVGVDRFREQMRQKWERYKAWSKTWCGFAALGEWLDISVANRADLPDTIRLARRTKPLFEDSDSECFIKFSYVKNMWSRRQGMKCEIYAYRTICTPPELADWDSGFAVKHVAPVYCRARCGLGGFREIMSCEWKENKADGFLCVAMHSYGQVTIRFKRK